MRVSVIVPTRDRAGLLAQALESVRANESAGYDIELVVASYRGEGDSRAVAERFRARWVETSTPGAAAARNAGLERATGDLVAFLDDDDVWVAGHLPLFVGSLAANPGLGALFGQVRNASPDLASLSAPWPPHAPGPDGMFKHVLHCYPQIGATVVRRSVVRMVGPFNEALPCAEDWDWHLRLALTTRVGWIAEPAVLFRQRSGPCEADLEWSRLPFVLPVCVANVARAPKTLGNLLAAGTAMVEHRGQYAARFWSHAVGDFAAGHRRRAVKNCGRSFVSSPPHCLKAMCASIPGVSALTRLGHHAGLQA